jgi:Tol biopolymer transport system component
MTRVTRQTGQVQTPWVSPDGSELVYLSDNGGHANLWVVRTDGTRARQITFERDPAITIGVPKWSPAGDAIVYIVNRDLPQLWVIRPDGRGARKLLERGMWAAWGDDGKWLYYTPNVNAERYTIEKVSLTGGTPVLVRGEDNSTAPTVGQGVLYFAALGAPEFGSLDWEIRRASPEDGPSELVGRIPEIVCRSRRCTSTRPFRKTGDGLPRRSVTERRRTCGCCQPRMDRGGR